MWIWAFAFGAYSCIALLKNFPPFEYVPNLPSGLDAVLSFAMALLIAFRVNQAYVRWWEARTLWGTLVNVSRNLAIKIRELHRPQADECRTIRNLIVAFCFGLKDHLRNDPNLRTLPGFEDERQTPRHMPSLIVGRLYGLFYSWQTERTLTDAQLWVLDSESRVMMDVCGGCEKIKTTPMPVSWRFVTWQCIGIYLLVLPWGLVDDFGIWTIPLTILVAYVLIAAEFIAHYIEEPFGLHEDHLDLESICQGIDESVSEILLENPK